MPITVTQDATMLAAAPEPNGVQMSAAAISADASPADVRAKASAFARDGFIGPCRLLTPSQCALIVHHCRFGSPPAPLDWVKGRAASDRLLYDVATAPVLLAQLQPLIGEDIVLWGASIIERAPGQIHPWHVDIETSEPSARTVSIWIGLENLSRASSIAVISRSHSIGRTIQQVQHAHGRRRGEATDDMVLEWAREFDPDARLIQPDMSDGDAVIFDGRLWHSTDNRSPCRRTALLLQYAAADQPMRIPDFGNGEWPFQFTERKPPALVVSGRADNGANRLVPAPRLRARGPVTTVVQPLKLPLNSTTNVPHQSFPLFDGPTSSLERMESHASVLLPGHVPHPPHVHDEEELLICLDGEAELIITDLQENETAQLQRLKPGDFVYYPAYQRHTIRGGDGGAVTYLMFKWQSPPTVTKEPLATGIWRGAGSGGGAESTTAFRISRLFEWPTAYLEKLHAHVSDLQPGGGYDPHVDDYDVAIVVLQGKVETVGCIVEPFGVIYYAAGEPHGMRNVGEGPARYLVFEFHAPKRAGAKEESRVDSPAITEPVAPPGDDSPPIAVSAEPVTSPRADSPPVAMSLEPVALPLTEPAAATDLSAPERLRSPTHHLRAINDWFWSDRRPRTHVIEYSILLYRWLRRRLGR